MMRDQSILLLILLGVCSTIFAGEASGQGNQCPFAHSIVTFSTSVKIREEPDFTSELRGSLPGNVAYNISDSLRKAEGCWVRIGVEWVYTPEKYIQEVVEGPATGNISSDNCFNSSEAYITGKMNIREEATTRSKTIDQAEPRTLYRVSGSYQGDTWCWLELYGSKGWMAYTDCVSGDISSVLPSIEIEGHTWLTGKILKAFEFLSDKSPRWFNYTVPKIRAIVGYDSALEAQARVIPRYRTITMGSFIRNMRNSQDHVAALAATFIHEACHVHQWDRGGRYFLDWAAEQECYTLEARALRNIDPGNPEIEWLKCWGEVYPLTSTCDLTLGLKW